jgi:toxin ParE1/3/4
MRVRFSDEAKQDLAEIGGFIRRRSPYWATRFTRELAYACRSLGDMPLAFPALPGHETSGIRKRIYKGYLIFYRVETDLISIVHIFNGARNYRPDLFPEDDQP